MCSATRYRFYSNIFPYRIFPPPVLAGLCMFGKMIFLARAKGGGAEQGNRGQKERKKESKKERQTDRQTDSTWPAPWNVYFPLPNIPPPPKIPRSLGGGNIQIKPVVPPETGIGHHPWRLSEPQKGADHSPPYSSKNRWPRIPCRPSRYGFPRNLRGTHTPA